MPGPSVLLIIWGMNEKEVLPNLKENTSNKLKGEEAEATIRGRKRSVDWAVVNARLLTL